MSAGRVQTCVRPVRRGAHGRWPRCDPRIGSRSTPPARSTTRLAGCPDPRSRPNIHQLLVTLAIRAAGFASPGSPILLARGSFGRPAVVLCVHHDRPIRCLRAFSSAIRLLSASRANGGISDCRNQASPVMRGRAPLDTDQAVRQAREELDQLEARQLALEDRTARPIDAVNLEHALAKIETELCGAASNHGLCDDREPRVTEPLRYRRHAPPSIGKPRPARPVARSLQRSPLVGSSLATRNLLSLDATMIATFRSSQAKNRLRNSR